MALPSQANQDATTLWVVDTSAWIEWLVRERGEDEADVVIAYTQKCIVWPLGG
jgi:predicted nucleic acid-binding protein